MAPLDHNTLIDACAGSGKTTVLLNRLKHILDSGVDDTQVLLCTFTRAASTSMRERLQNLLGRTHSVWCETLDALALTQLNEFGDLPGVCPACELSVSEYALNFLRALDSDAGR